MHPAVRASTLPALETRLHDFERRFGASSTLMHAADVDQGSDEFLEWQSLYRRVMAIKDRPQLEPI